MEAIEVSNREDCGQRYLATETKIVLDKLIDGTNYNICGEMKQEYRPELLFYPPNYHKCHLTIKPKINYTKLDNIEIMNQSSLIPLWQLISQLWGSYSNTTLTEDFAYKLNKIAPGKEFFVEEIERNYDSFSYGEYETKLKGEIDGKKCTFVIYYREHGDYDCDQSIEFLD